MPVSLVVGITLPWAGAHAEIGMKHIQQEHDNYDSEKLWSTAAEFNTE